MEHSRLETCLFGCCHLVDGKPVSKKQYDEALIHQPGFYPAVPPWGRNAIAESIVACRKAVVRMGRERS